MLVGERMSHPVISLAPDMPILDALSLFKRERIRRAPVIQDGKLVGIVTDKDLLHASPSPATSLSIWELNYLLSKITIAEVMAKKVLTVTEGTPIKEAARIMADNKIGGLPVVRDGHVVGIITETDQFKIFLELMGAREKGIRVTVLVPDKPGQLARPGKAIAEINGNIIAFGTFAGKDSSNRMITFKVAGPKSRQVQETITPLVESLIDIREC